MKSALLIGFAGLALILGFSHINPPSQVSALSGSQFQAGRIMDDSIFFATNTIGASDIQLFLNSKVPVCDTNGTQAYGGTTRAAYGTSRGYPPPYTCLRNYSQSTPTKTAESGLCGHYNGGTKSAASIIYDIGQACGINPRALIVLLEKEQSLVVDDWPWSIQYRSATGYGCPDTAPCDAEYYGFFNQVYNAARQFKRYQKDANLFNFQPNQSSYIQYNPNAGCGGTNVFIQNQTTAGLYNYTPYQPNASALANLYGSGDSCGAYGNRNFWRLFNDWFGGVNGAPYHWQLASQEAYSNSSRTQPFSSVVTVQPGQKIYMRVKARNLGFQTWNSSFVTLATSKPNDRTSVFYDSTWVNSKRPARLIESDVAPSEVGTFEFILTAPQITGSYKEYFNVVADGHMWLNDIGMYYAINVVNPTQSLSGVDAVLNAGEKIVPNQHILSTGAQSALRLQTDGNLVLYWNFNQAVWDTDTNGATPGELIMQPDGNLVLKNVSGTPVWYSGTYGNPGARLVSQTDGNLVIYNVSNQPVWSIYEVHNPNQLNYVNTTLYGASMYIYQSLETANRKYKFVLQPDGNVVLYDNTNKALWHTGTGGKPATRLALQPDGNVVLYDNTNKALWHTGTFGKGLTRLTIQTDGNLVVYNGLGEALWNSKTAGQ